MADPAFAYFVGISSLALIFLSVSVIGWLDVSAWLERLRFDRLVALANARTKTKKTDDALAENTPSS